MDTINQAIVVAHGSATVPHYGFLQKTYDKRPYQPLVAELASRFAITDTTDLNYDSAMVYHLCQQEEHCLLLSLVGKFFLLFDSLVDRECLVEQPATEESRAVFRTVQQHGFVSIDRTTLERHTCLVDDEGVSKTVWEALFDRS
ncbi:hypothetical protein [Hymenobacter convexus]|uniref:hypothetical protein n=1 Tax=Hymenobacter sp. CA1UV-4 TaxID=3063782 RepID=UPI0027124C51|nr:hypothetical protein [Hymenobacter sp. CA1UV-4]MDO7853133.1 hypothetical protein [Hymenobacter sp. CA1UV-4]